MWHKVMWFLRDKFIAILFIICPSIVPAQVGQNYFQSSPANLYDWRSTLTNPSINAFQTGALEVGFKIFHLGFADQGSTLFTSGYALLNLPRLLPLKLALGVQSQLFSTPIYREVDMRLTLSRQIFGRISLGFGAGFRGISFQTDSFDLIDLDDPVFANGSSRWQPDLSAGVTLMPFSQIIIGVGVRHLNRPSVSLIDDSIKLDPTITIAMAFNFGSLAFHSGGSTLQDRTSPSPRGFLQLHNASVGMIQLGYEDDAAWLRSRLHITGPISIGYGFSYPLGDLQGSGSGSHETSLVYEFGRLRSIPDLGTPPRDWIPFLPKMSRIDVASQFAALADSEAVDIFEKILVREIDEEIDSKTLAKLSVFDLGFLDSSFVEKTFPFELQQISIFDTTAEFTGQYSTSYRSSLARLRSDLAANPVDVILVAPETEQHRAMALGNYLQEVLGTTETQVTINRARFLSRVDSLKLTRNVDLLEIKPTEALILLRPSTVTFTVFLIASESYGKTWTLVVENAEGRRIFTHSGESKIPTEVAWDWHDSTGEVIAPGFYRYYVEWRDRNDRIRRSPARKLYARKLQRNIHIKIVRKYESPEKGANKIGIILNK